MSDVRFRAVQLWLLLTYGDERSYRGNAGYDDHAGEAYRYDSKVQNHKSVSIGDVVILVGRGARRVHEIQGVGHIDRIVAEEGTKTISRCPSCHRSQLHERTTLHPRFRCKVGHVFDDPLGTREPVTLYTASYGESYVSLKGMLPPGFVKRLQVNQGDQLAIRRARPEVLAEIGTRIPDLGRFLDGVHFKP